MSVRNAWSKEAHIGECLMFLLNNAEWGKDAPLVTTFLESPYAACCEDALKNVRWDALHISRTHGADHIARTICHGAMGAMEEQLPLADTMLLLDACAYHDVGRVNDETDPEHGRRAAQRLEELTGREGEELAEICAAVDAHSRDDARLLEMLNYYRVQDKQRGALLTQLLKDADGLDRVRINDLDPNYLRFSHSKDRVHFAEALYAAMITIA